MSIPPRSLSVIIPCYNEEQAIPFVLSRWREIHPRLLQAGLHRAELIVVDDASDDGSAQALKNASDLRLIQHPERQGYGAALRTGFQASSGDLIAFYDMDNTYDPASLLDLITHLDLHEAHLVCGDRLSQVGGMPLTRRIGNALFVKTIEVLYRLKINDSTTGLRVFRREMLETFATIPVNRLSFSLAMTLLSLKRGLKVVEVPIHYDRRVGHSKLSVLLDGPLFLWLILNYWLFTRRTAAPVLVSSRPSPASNRVRQTL